MSIFTNKKKSIPEDAVPATVEQAIPLQDIYEDGICLVGRNLYSKTYRFTDINYATASREDKEGMFLAYSQILNSFDTQADTKITINNRRMNRQKFEQHSLLELQGDMLDRYRAEYIVMCLFAGEVNALLMQLLRLNLQYAAVSLTPITEEIIKALPVLFYASVMSEKWERLLSLSMALGIGFAIMENVYVVTQNIESADVLLALIRGFATGLMHGICTATVGYGISFVRKCKKLFYTGTFGLLLVAVIYHGIFNTLVQSPYQAVGFFMPIVTYIPVVVYIIKKKIKIK